MCCLLLMHRRQAAVIRIGPANWPAGQGRVNSNRANYSGETAGISKIHWQKGRFSVTGQAASDHGVRTAPDASWLSEVGVDSRDRRSVSVSRFRVSSSEAI
ncbi:hypothetical protein RHA1_ro11248 (plasmid) [Rhodococcus jostii RHA1]|uniref:Uncharacterized protein n=1 Tax=Rhodococcus jostii (strain RHA1) TaxID=101510 RepID=Q0RUZ1_RHOJR|nr:hypothetical protein RHA1_ro11248 [Rhodococcus jostii RHA1]